MVTNIHKQRLQHICNTPWPSLRGEVMDLCHSGGLENLEQAAMLVADAELRGMLSDADKTPDHVWTRLHHAAHPLAWISPRRGDLEKNLVGRNSDGHYSYSLPPERPGKLLSDGEKATLDMLEAHAERGLKPFQSILTHSNGDANTYSFLASSAVTPSKQIAHAIAAAHPHIGRDATARQVETIDVVEAIAMTAINGGVYDNGLAAAFGRLATWQAMSWLVGREEAPSSQGVIEQAARCLWLRFAPTDRWFSNVGNDGCYACINADRVRIAVISWSDTD